MNKKIMRLSIIMIKLSIRMMK